MKIAIIGAGSVGTNLHHAFEQKGIKTQLIHARPLTSGQTVSDPTLNEKMGKCENAQMLNDQINDQMVNDQIVNNFDVYIYTVADHALADVVSKIDAPKALHLHTSGSMPIEVFGADKPHAGVMYFFQSFSREVLIDDWSTIPCFIEGKNIDDIAAVYSLAQCLTSRIYEANRHDRERLHIAGIFANNYTNLMYRMAEQILQDTQIPFEALLPLIDNTAAKVHAMKPADAQTGPAKRGDNQVINHHLHVLEESGKNAPLKAEKQFSAEEMASVYRALAALIEKAHNH